MKLSPHTTRFDGAVPPVDGTWTEASPLPPRRRRRRVLRHPFLWFVILPTLLIAGYFYTIAASQYVSDARFVVRGRSDAGAPSLASTLAQAGLGSAPSSSDAQAVREYLISVDGMSKLNDRVDLVALYRREDADVWARLWHTDPERIARYMSGMVTISQDNAAGIMGIRVRAFSPEDARLVARELLALGESMVNRLSERSREDTLRIARREVEIAERRVVAAREALVAFRERAQNLDATVEVRGAVDTLTRMEALLAQARTDLRERMAFMRPDNPALVSSRNRVEALERQIESERQRQTRAGQGGLSQQLADFERLSLEREFADRQLGSATQSLEMARIEAQRQQLFLERVVEPNLPVYPLYPKKIVTILSAFAILTIMYFIGWLLVAGLREHAA